MDEKEKGMALLACIEEAKEGKHTSATIESSTVPGDIAIQKCSPALMMMSEQLIAYEDK
jgi:hypothetical protein